MAKRVRIVKEWVGDQLFTRRIQEDIPEAVEEVKQPEPPKEEPVVAPKPVAEPEKVEESKPQDKDSYYTKSELRANQKDDLKRMCKNRRMSVVGAKQDLIDRLMKYQEKKSK